MPSRNPTTSLEGILSVVTRSVDVRQTLSAALEQISSAEAQTRELDPNGSILFTAPFPPATALVLNTNRKIRYRLNGGTEDFVLSKLFLVFGAEITSVEIFNDQQANPDRVRVEALFVAGGELV